MNGKNYETIAITDLELFAMIDDIDENEEASNEV